MVKKLSAIGNSLGLVIEKPILELLKIDRDTDLEISTDGERLIIEPIRGLRRKRVTEAARRAMDAHDKTLKKLAK
jgi:antitoxin component of MazEF toxin-antitoxin module